MTLGRRWSQTGLNAKREFALLLKLMLKSKVFCEVSGIAETVTVVIRILNKERYKL